MSKAVSRENNEAKGEIQPRVLDLRSGAKYVGVSYWTMRDYVLQGRIRALQLPALTPREGERRRRSLRRVLIDRNELDAWIDSLKR